jgi:hypothetical protein
VLVGSGYGVRCCRKPYRSLNPIRAIGVRPGDLTVLSEHVKTRRKAHDTYQSRTAYVRGMLDRTFGSEKLVSKIGASFRKQKAEVSHLQWCLTVRKRGDQRRDRRVRKAARAAQADLADLQRCRIGFPLPGRFIRAEGAEEDAQDVGLTTFPGEKSFTSPLDVWAAVAERALDLSGCYRLMKSLALAVKRVSEMDCPICGRHSITYPTLCFGYYFRVRRTTLAYVREVSESSLSSVGEVSEARRIGWAERLLEREQSKLVRLVVDRVVGMFPAINLAVSIPKLGKRFENAAYMAALAVGGPSLGAAVVRASVREGVRRRLKRAVVRSRSGSGPPTWSRGTASSARSASGRRRLLLVRDEAQNRGGLPVIVEGTYDVPVTPSFVCAQCGVQIWPHISGAPWPVAWAMVGTRFVFLCSQCLPAYDFNAERLLSGGREPTVEEMEMVEDLASVPLSSVRDQYGLGAPMLPFDGLTFELVSLMLTSWLMLLEYDPEVSGPFVVEKSLPNLGGEPICFLFVHRTGARVDRPRLSAGVRLEPSTWRSSLGLHASGPVSYTGP